MQNQQQGLYPQYPQQRQPQMPQQQGYPQPMPPMPMQQPAPQMPMQPVQQPYAPQQMPPQQLPPQGYPQQHTMPQMPAQPFPPQQMPQQMPPQAYPGQPLMQQPPMQQPPRQPTGSVAMSPQFRQMTQPVQAQHDNLITAVTSGKKSAWMMAAGVVLALIYALYVSINYGGVSKIIPHIVVTWLSVLCSGAAAYLYDSRMILVAGAGLVIAMLLFLNTWYLIIPAAILCVLAYFFQDQ